jgi:hypothetical protein
MAQETKVEETRCSLQTFERNRYFYGKPMTVSDFEAEQRYLIGKQRYVNRLVHGAGVLCGLQVTVPTSFSAERPTVELAEGAALDCCGNLIIVSRSSTAEVKGDFDPDGLNYLYIKYAECSKSPVMLAANGSSCEEVCCYNRIQETFEVVASRTAPGGGKAVPPAVAPPRVKADGPPPDPETVCRNLTEQYYKDNLKSCPGCDDPLVFLAVFDSGKGAMDETETARYRSVVFNNEMLHELLCGHVTDYDNPHYTTAAQVLALQSVNGVGNTPGRTTFVGNIDLASKDKTIGVKDDVNALKIDLFLAADSVKPSHLNAEVIQNLIKSSKTVSVEPHPTTKSITLNTTPAKSVTSVGGARKVGESSSYAPEDHVHDLAEGVVERRHFNTDIYANLIQGGGIIKVEGQAATKTIKISAEVAPGDEPKLVSSVTGTKQVGKSERYAREDHAHDLNINGRSPNESGQFLLTPGANVTIVNGAVANELVISAAGGGKATEIATGIFSFDDVRPQERRHSTLIAHRLDAELVAVILAEEESEGLRSAEGERLTSTNVSARFGDVTDFDAEAPFLMAEVDYNQKTIQISLKDRRQDSRLDTGVKLTDEGGVKFIPSDAAAPRIETASGGKDASGSIAPSGALAPSGAPDDNIIDPNVRTYRIRWWAIPA